MSSRTGLYYHVPIDARRTKRNKENVAPCVVVLCRHINGALHMTIRHNIKKMSNRIIECRCRCLALLIAALSLRLSFVDLSMRGSTGDNMTHYENVTSNAVSSVALHYQI